MADYMSCSTALTHLEITDAWTCVYIQAMGYWWVYLLYVIVIAGLYMTTKRPGLVAVLTLVGAAVGSVWLPVEVQYGLYIIAVISLGAMIYLMIRGRDSSGG